MMADGTRPSFRKTQRAPHSCISCATRKVKCDKKVPCSTCIQRGQAQACMRETVLVRGAVTSWMENPNVPTYDELRSENIRLREQLVNRPVNDKTQVRAISAIHPLRKQYLAQGDDLESLLWESVSSASLASSSSVLGWQDIIIPTRTCSEQFIAFDKEWNSWVHYGLEYRRFEEECDDFFARRERGESLDHMNASWMAVYFSTLSAAIIMMDERKAQALLEISGFDYDSIAKNWYDSAMFCLYRADFIRKPSVRTVQAIVILGICFNNFGDSELNQHMWSCAIRIAQKFGLSAGRATEFLSVEAQRRLWWTLIICEWLCIPYHNPQVEEVDFDTQLPSAISTPSNSHGAMDPVYYHIFMAKTATVHHRFWKAIVANTTPLDKIVRTTDEQLAEVIDTLPEHLKPENEGNKTLYELEQRQPWIRWQRFDVTLVLLHLRLRVNRALQDQWLASPGQYSWARTISLKSAQSIIWINSNWDQPVSMRKQWALSHHMFVSAIFLIREYGNGNVIENQEYLEAIMTAVDLLDQVKSQSVLAYQAVRILRDEVNKLQNCIIQTVTV